MDTTVILEE